MKYKIVRTPGASGKHDGYIICVTSEPRPGPSTHVAACLKRLGINLSELKKKEGFSGLETQDMVLRIVKGKNLVRVVLLGLGKRSDVNAILMRRRMQRAGTIALSREIRRPAVILPPGLRMSHGICLHSVVLGLHLGTATQVRYTAKKKKRAVPASTEIVLPRSDATRLKRQLERSTTLGDIIVEARSWVAEPANMLGPAELSRKIVNLGKKHGVASQAWGASRIRKERMGLLEAVGRGSSRKPRFVRMRWSPAGKRRSRMPHVVLVGKGIVFDTGGLSLKPAKSMIGMKNDMAGAAVAAASAAAAAALGLRVRLTALLALAENTPSSTSYRPGDVITGRSGRSVEIINTDAEGRLVMADALTLAAESKPDAIIDIATLTGSCIVALGHFTAGLWSNDDGLAGRLLEAAEESGESLWRMPLSREIRPFMRSDVADIRNTQADPYGGATAAALFLQEFIGQTPWAHLDIAGPAFHERRTEVWPRGATGYGISTIVRFLEHLSSS
jgi:leucyl aminopeptidase